MKIVCITLVGDYAKRAGGLYEIPVIGRNKSETEAHLKERGVTVSFYYGVRAKQLGIETTLPYEIDAPGSGYRMPVPQTGCWISHRSLWSALLLLPDDVFFVLEDDVVFPSDWRERLERNMRVLPEDWDFFYVGSCCAEDKPKTHIAEQVYEVKYPFCTHAYMIRKKALMTLIKTTDDARCYAPIDISVAMHSAPHLATYTMLPRLVDQFNTPLVP